MHKSLSQGVYYEILAYLLVLTFCYAPAKRILWIFNTLEFMQLALPQFSRHSKMSKLHWSGRNEENGIHG